MRTDSGWTSARGQIAWLLGLVVSTAIVVHLERLELGGILVGLDTNPLSQQHLSDQITLDDLRARVSNADPARTEDVVALLLALSSAAILNDDPELRDDAAALLGEIPAPIADDPLIIEASAITRRIFDL